VARGDASKTDGDRSALSGTQRKLLAAIAEAGSNGIYANRLPNTHPELDLDREAIVYRAKDLAANGYITIKPLTDLLYTVTDKGSAALA
jgi:DNA-binding MarR family transcriptional regulator